MEVDMTEKKQKVFLLNCALLVFAIIALELVILIIEYLFYKSTDLFHFGFRAVATHWFFTYIAWGVGAFFLFQKAKHRNFNVFEFKKPMIKKNTILATILFVVTLISYLSYRNYSLEETNQATTFLEYFKPSLEYRAFSNLFNSNAPFAMIMQTIYYLFEVVLMTLAIAFGHEAGERIFKNSKIPWGGIFLALTWGLGHILTQDLTTGIICFVMSFIYGSLYLLLNKNIKITYVFVFLLFLL